jgi:hypothetical protein
VSTAIVTVAVGIGGCLSYLPTFGTGFLNEPKFGELQMQSIQRLSEEQKQAALAEYADACDCGKNGLE